MKTQEELLKKNKLKQKDNTIQIQFLNSILQQLKGMFQTVFRPNFIRKIQTNTPNANSINSLFEKQNDIQDFTITDIKNKEIKIKSENNQNRCERMIEEAINQLADHKISEDCQILSIEEISSIKDEMNDQNGISDQSQDFEIKPKRIKKKKRTKKIENQDSPRKPISSFVHYYAARAKEIRSNAQSGTVGNLAKLLSAQWNSLSKEEKQPYKKAAIESLETYYYEKEMKERNLGESKSDRKEVKKVKKNSCEHGHKGSVSSFFIFFKYNSQKIAKKYNESQRGKLAKLASQQWKKMSEQQKNVYATISRVQRKKFDEMMSLQKQRQKKAKLIVRKKKEHDQQFEQYKPNTYKKNNLKPEQQKSKEKLMSNLKGQTDGTKTIQRNSNIESQNDNLNMDLRKNQRMNKEVEILLNEDQQKVQSKNQKNIINFQKCNVIQLNSNEEEDNNERIHPKRFRRVVFHKQVKQKQPVNAFLIYYQQTLKDIKESFDKAHGSQLVKIASSRWAELGEEEKLHFYDLAKERRRTHELSMKNRQLNMYDSKIIKARKEIIRS